MQIMFLFFFCCCAKGPKGSFSLKMVVCYVVIYPIKQGGEHVAQLLGRGLFCMRRICEINTVEVSELKDETKRIESRKMGERFLKKHAQFKRAQRNYQTVMKKC